MFYFQSIELANSAIHSYRKFFSESQVHSRQANSFGFPVSDIPNQVIDEEVKRLREISLKTHSSKLGPSSSCFTLQNYGSSCSSICFSPNFSTLCIGTNLSYIDVWSCLGNVLKTLKPSTELAAYDLNQMASLDEIMEETGSYSKRLIGHSGAISSLNVTRDCSSILSSSFDNSLRLWSTVTFSCIAAYNSHAYPVWDSDISPLGHYFASCSADRTCRLWNFDYPHPVRIYAGHLSDVDVLKFHPNGCYFGSGSSDKTCRLWEVSSGNCVRLFQGHSRPINAMSFSKNGRLLAAGDLSGQVCLYDIHEGKLVWKSSTAAIKPSHVLSMDFSNDDKVLAVSYGDCRIKVFNCEDFNQKPTEYFTKQTPIYAARFNHRDILMCAGPFLPE